nr:hypothetical protein [Paraburkholderia sp. J76]
MKNILLHDTRNGHHRIASVLVAGAAMIAACLAAFRGASAREVVVLTPPAARGLCMAARLLGLAALPLCLGAEPVDPARAQRAAATAARACIERHETLDRCAVPL